MKTLSGFDYRTRRPMSAPLRLVKREIREARASDLLSRVRLPDGQVDALIYERVAYLSRTRRKLVREWHGIEGG